MLEIKFEKKNQNLSRFIRYFQNPQYFTWHATILFLQPISHPSPQRMKNISINITPSQNITQQCSHLTSAECKLFDS